MAALNEIAHDMCTQALRHGVSQRNLPRGLSIQLIVVGGNHILTLRRAFTGPSDQECEICRDAFDVPAGTAAQWGISEVTFRWST